MPRARSQNGGARRQNLEETMRRLADEATAAGDAILEAELGIEDLHTGLICRQRSRQYIMNRCRFRACL